LNAVADSRTSLSEGDGTRIPQLLRELLYVVNDIELCAAGEEKLQVWFALRRPIARFRKLYEDLDRLTERFDKMQEMLREQQRKSADATRA
jgi:hypothetical protein